MIDTLLFEVRLAGFRVYLCFAIVPFGLYLVVEDFFFGDAVPLLRRFIFLPHAFAAGDPFFIAMFDPSPISFFTSIINPKRF